MAAEAFMAMRKDIGEIGGDLKAQLDIAIENANARDKKAEKIIFWTIIFTALVGMMPITNWICIIANTVMIISVGRIYGFTSNRHHVAALIKQVIMTVAISSTASYLGILFVIEVLGGGFVTLENRIGVTGLLGALLEGGITFALGYTAKTYFARGCIIDREMMLRGIGQRNRL